MTGFMSQFHAWAGTVGLDGGLLAALRIAWHAGRVVDKIDQHIKTTTSLFDAIHRRVEWLEQHRR